MMKLILYTSIRFPKYEKQTKSKESGYLYKQKNTSKDFILSVTQEHHKPNIPQGTRNTFIKTLLCTVTQAAE